MTTDSAPPTGMDEAAPAARPRRRRIVFWICRYLPAEIAGTATMVIAGVLVAAWTDAPLLIAIAGVLGESLGFYAVLFVTVFAEQWAHAAHGPWPRRRALARTLVLLVAEFGPAEIVDSLLVRPAALLAGVWVLGDPFWGLLGGKLVADVVFYVVAAGAFTVTVRTGMREGALRLPRLRVRRRPRRGPNRGAADVDAVARVPLVG